MSGMVVFQGMPKTPEETAQRQALAKRLCTPVVDCSDSDFEFILEARPDIAERLRKLL